MATPRTLIGSAFRAIGATALGDNPDAEELIAGLAALQDLVGELHEAKGPLLDVDVPVGLNDPQVTPTTTWIAGENQRVRIQATYTVEVTLPNSIFLFGDYDPYDYGFFIPQIRSPVQGSTDEADGITTRQPRDGARVEVVGVANGLYWYRADLNSWMSAYGLTLDAESPFNDRYSSAVSALLAERLIELLGAAQMSPSLAARIGRSRAEMLTRPGTARDPVRATYF
ncbi:MAG: hypothetical protein ACREEH_03730 [Caulobacteraceae bacterium]